MEIIKRTIGINGGNNREIACRLVPANLATIKYEKTIKNDVMPL